MAAPNLVLSLFGLFILLAGATGLEEGLPMAAPICPIEPYETTDKRIDNYHWLRLSDEEKTENPAGDHRQKVEAYLNSENEYLRSQMKHNEELKNKVFNEMKGRIKEDDAAVPYKYNGWYYSERYAEGSDYPIFERYLGTVDGQLQQLLDVNKLAEGHEYFSISSARVSPDNQIVGYSFDNVSRRMYTIHFRNLVTGEMYPDEILNTGGGFIWANDNRAIFYIKKDEVTLRGYQVFKHILGTLQDEDELIFEETDNTFYCGISKSKSQKYLNIISFSTLTSEIRILDLENANAALKIFQKRTTGHIYIIFHSNENFYILTNLNGENFCLMSCPIDKTSKENWKLEILHRNETLLKQIDVFKKFLVITERTGGLTNFHIIGQNVDFDYYIDFVDEAYEASIKDNYEFNSEVLRYEYTSMKTPDSTFDFDMNTKKQILLKQKEVIGGYNPEDYISERIMATVHDGKQVPISLVYKKGLECNGLNPTLLEGYGAYGSSRAPSFDSNRLSLLDRGFIYAIAHIRGGDTMGRSWYKDGTLLKKKNTFRDFNDCAHFLIHKNYTSPAKLMAMGGSAGGLLIGAVINMEPQLYKGVVAKVPFVDVISTMLDESIPLTTGEYDEWGNPNDEEYYKYMLSYSPYDNVVAQDYPSILVTAGYHDSQVQYWEAAKWVAKLRALKTDNNTLLLFTNMDAGHGGASGRFEALKKTALIYAFLLDLVGISD